MRPSAHIELCSRYIAEFPQAEAAMRNVLRLPEPQLEEILQRCVECDVALGFSEKRAQFVYAVTVERRRQLVAALGAPSSELD